MFTCLFLLLGLLTTWAEGGVFFPLSSVNITLPRAYNVAHPLLPLVELILLKDVPDFLTEENSRSSAAPIFTLLDNKMTDLFYVIGHELRVNDKFLDTQFKLNQSTQHYRLIIEGSLEGEGSATMTVNVFLYDTPMNCELQSYAICFWGAEKFQVAESLEEAILGTISSPLITGLCPNFSVTYTSKNPDLKVIRQGNGQGAWALKLTEKPDREKSDTIKSKLTCTVSGGIEKEYQNEVTVLVRDLDDSVPIITVHSSDLGNYIAKGQSIASLEIRDKDSASVNEIDVHLDKIPWNMSVSCSPRNHSSQTHISCEVISEEDIQYHDEEVVEFSVIDKTLIIGSGSRKRKGEIHLKTSSPLALPIISNDLFKPSVNMSIHHGRMYNYVRITNPNRRVLNGSFSINSTLFSITPDDGIIYFHCTEPSCKKQHKQLIASKHVVEVSWSGKRVTGSQVIEINFHWPENGTYCVRNEKWCSTIKKEETCMESCGDGGEINNFACSWEWITKPSWKNYSACTVSKNTCPDGVCDGFEKLHEGICPFDCERNSLGLTFKGYCFWDSQTTHMLCSSTNSFDYKEKPTNEKKVVNCDTFCQITFAAFGLAMLVAIGIISVFYRNYRRVKKRCPSRPMKGELLSMTYEESSRPLGEINSPAKPEFYDSKWEFPRHRLTIEETVGEGEFGMVLKARADGIQGHTETMTVAIKTLKTGSKDPELGDLISELELLKDVDHPNVIKLLGACTVEDGPLYVIIEYAEYGSLRNFLKKHRQSHNDIDKGSNFYLNGLAPLTSTNVLTFAWQIAKGMAYLTEMKLVHRDLAARNVLLTKDLVCKISDFGLTRDIYEDDTYLKRSKGRVPIKWMALESLADHVYTTKSDVWSYGILLWELSTKGSSPYPGVPPQNLFNLLLDGYRMERPPGCSPELYKIMRDCWAKMPAQRPSFASLVRQFENMLAEGREYLDLGFSAFENRQYMEEEPDLKWQFESYDHPRPPCGCPPEECAHIRRPCSCPPGLCIHPKYANEIKTVHNDLWDSNVDDKANKNDITTVQKLTYVT